MGSSNELFKFIWGKRISGYFSNNVKFVEEYYPIKYPTDGTDTRINPSLYKGEYKIIVNNKEYKGKWWLDDRTEKWYQKDICYEVDKQISCAWLFRDKQSEARYGPDGIVTYYYADPFTCNKNATWNDCKIIAKITKTEYIDSTEQKVAEKKAAKELKGKTIFCEEGDLILWFKFGGTKVTPNTKGYSLSKETTNRSPCEGCILTHFYYVSEFGSGYTTDANWIYFDNQNYRKLSRKTLEFHNPSININKDNLNIEDLNAGKIFTKNKVQCELNKKGTDGNKLKKDEVRKYIGSMESRYNRLLRDHALEIYNSKTKDNLL